MKTAYEQYKPLAEKVLLEAKEIIKLSGGIGKGTFATSKLDGFTADPNSADVAARPQDFCFCTVGAIRCAAQRVLPDVEVNERAAAVTTAVALVAECILNDALGDYEDPYPLIFIYNDDEDRITDDIFHQLDCAVEKTK